MLDPPNDPQTGLAKDISGAPTPRCRASRRQRQALEGPAAAPPGHLETGVEKGRVEGLTPLGMVRKKSDE